MLNFHGNGRETAASPFPFRIFFLLFAFFRPFFWLCSPPPSPVETRAMRRMRSNIHSGCPASVPRRFFRSLGEFSFARLPCVVLSAKKAQSEDNFQVENRTFHVFLSKKQPCSERRAQILAQLVKSLFCALPVFRSI